MNYELLDDFAFNEAINNIFNSGRDIKTRFKCPLCGDGKILDNHEYCCSSCNPIHTTINNAIVRLIISNLQKELKAEYYCNTDK